MDNKIYTIDVTEPNTEEAFKEDRKEALQRLLEMHLMGARLFPEERSAGDSIDRAIESGDVTESAHAFRYVFNRIRDLFRILDAAGVDEAEKYVMANKAIAELMAVTDEEHPMNFDLMAMPKVSERAKGN